MEIDILGTKRHCQVDDVVAYQRDMSRIPVDY